MYALFLPLLFFCHAHFCLTLASPPFAPLTQRMCSDMLPNPPKAGPQKTSAPYIINVKPQRYKDKEKVEVTLTATKDKYPIRALFLQARIADCSDPEFPTIQGSFQHKKDFLHTIKCGNRINNVAANRVYNESDNRKSVSVDWYADDKMKKSIYFRATVVADSETYWTEILSRVVHHKSSSDNTTEAPKCDVQIPGSGHTWHVSGLLFCFVLVLTVLS